jgi:hypothetical protein
MSKFLSNLRGTLESIFKIKRADLDASALTDARTMALPDASGTVLLDTTAPGNDGEVLFNDGGSFMADAGFKYDPVNGRMELTGQQGYRINGPVGPVDLFQLDEDGGQGLSIYTNGPNYGAFVLNGHGNDGVIGDSFAMFGVIQGAVGPDSPASYFMNINRTVGFEYAVNGAPRFSCNDTAHTITVGEVHTSILSPAQITANTDNWAPTNHEKTRIFRLSTDASRNLTGLQGGVNGRRITISNVGAQNLVFVHDATSTAANRFLCPGSVNFTLNANDSIDLWYDGTSSRWRLVSF